MWLILLGTALAAAPPRNEVGRVHTTAGLAGPDWGLFAELSANLAQRLAVRGGGDLVFVADRAPADTYLLAEVQAGPYWLSPFVAGGGVLEVRPDRPLPEMVSPRWRAELGLRGLVRWGAGIHLAAATDGSRLEGRCGGYLSW